MTVFKLDDHPHRRRNPLTGEWVLFPLTEPSDPGKARSRNRHPTSALLMIPTVTFALATNGPVVCATLNTKAPLSLPTILPRCCPTRLWLAASTPC